MTIKVWEIGMGSVGAPNVVRDKKNVCALTISHAIDKAEAAERKFCTQMGEDEGEEFTPDKAISARFLCEIEDDE